MPRVFACRFAALLMSCVCRSIDTRWRVLGPTLATLALLLIAGSDYLAAQQPVPKEYRNERIMVIVPMIGTGRADDPIRPMFAPVPPDPTALKPNAAQQAPTTPPQFLSMTYEISDDGKTALVEFVAKTRDSFKDILASKLPEVKVFERGKSTAADVEREFQKVKPTYTFTKDKPVKAISTNGTNASTGRAQ